MDLFSSFLKWTGLGSDPEPVDVDYSSLIQSEPMMSVGSPAAIYETPPLMASPEQERGFTAILEDAIKQSASRIDGITAENRALREEREGLGNWAESQWSQVGAGALGGLAAALAGGSMADIATGFGTMGTSYYNNLEAQEKAKILNLDKLIESNDNAVKNWTDFGQSLTSAGLTNASQLERDLRTGQIPGTPQREAINREKLDMTQRELDLRDPSITVDGVTKRKSEWQTEAEQRRIQTVEDRAIRQDEEAKKNRTIPPQSPDAPVKVAWKEGAPQVPERLTAFNKETVKHRDAYGAVAKLERAVKKFEDSQTGDAWTEMKSAAADAVNTLATAYGAGGAITEIEAIIKTFAVSNALASHPLNTPAEYLKAKARGENPLLTAQLGLRSLERTIKTYADDAGLEVMFNSPSGSGSAKDRLKQLAREGKRG